MATRIATHILKNSNILNRPLPSTLFKGEPIVNTADGIVYFSGNTASTNGWTPAGTNTTFFEVGSNLYDLQLRNRITKYEGATGAGLVGKFLSGTTSGFTLADISSIVGVDTYTTGFTYSNNVATIKRNQGQADLSIVINAMTGLTVNGTFSATTSNIGTANINTLNATGGTVTTLASTTATLGTANITTENVNTLNATGGTITTLGSTTANLGTANITTLNATGGTITTLNVNSIASYNGLSNVAGQFLSGTTSGFALAAISAITGVDTYVTGFTYSNNVATIKRNQGQADLSILINTMTGLTVTGSLSAATYLGLPISIVNTSNLVSTGFAGTGAGASAVTNSNFFGPDAGYSASSASASNFIGQQAGYLATNASGSNFLGQSAGYGATNASYANFIGYSTGQNATGASNSNFFGYVAGYQATNATQSNFFGSQAGYSATNAQNSNFIGNQAGNAATNASYTNFIGSYAGQNATNATQSNFLGYYAGNGATNASGSTFIGNNAGINATNAQNSNFIGQYAGQTASSASGSTFMGYSAGYNATGASYSNIFGYNAGYASNPTLSIGKNNIIVGTNISLSAGTTNAINLGGVLFGTGTYSNPFGATSLAGQSNGKIGINVVTPLEALHVSGNVRTEGGVYAVTAFTGSYSDGIVTDYVTGNGRISVGSADGITFYNGGVGVNPLATLTAGGILSAATGNFVSSNIATLNATGGTITTLGSTTANLGTANVTTLNATGGTITTLGASTLNLGNIASYNGLTNVAGQFLSGTTSGFSLAPISAITGVDTYVTGFTYAPTTNTITLAQNQGQAAKTVTISTVSGLTVSNLTSNYLVYATTGGALTTGGAGAAQFDGTNMILPAAGSLSVGTGGLIVGAGGSPGVSGTGDVVINGSLTVFGASVSAFTSQLYVEDNNVTLNYNPTGNTTATSIGAGWTLQDGNGVNGGSVNFDVRAMNTFTGITSTNIPSISEYGGSTGYANRAWVTQLNDVVIRSNNVTTPNGVRVLAEFDILDGGSY